jgi:transmembrane sensor
MKNEIFISLLSKKLSGAMVEEERILFNQMIQEEEAYRAIAVQLDRDGKENADEEASRAKLAQIWEMIKAKENESFHGKFKYATPVQGLTSNKLLKVAAMLALVLGVGLLGYWILDKNQNQDFATLTTTTNKTFKMLDDGTKVWLNKNSTLHYTKAFGIRKREMMLEGEAYFDVAKNATIPLIIQTSNLAIEVKGTAFNVNAPKASTQIQVALVRGLIQITDKLNPKRTVLLHPNEQLSFDKKQPHGEAKLLVQQMKPAVLLNQVKWIADTLVFNKEKLSVLALRLEKKYDLKIEIQSEKLKDKRFSGTFTNETIQQALTALQLSYPLTYTINHRWVTIRD